MSDAINDNCPWSGKPVSDDSLTRYRGQTVGFCNPGCRDKFDAATEMFDRALVGAGTTYVEREFRAAGLWTIPGLRLKAYAIGTGDPVSPATLDAARSWSEAVLPDAAATEGGSSGLGYAIVHAGSLGTWLLAQWWAHGDICCQRMALAPPGTRAFASVGERPLHACVWEQVVIGHERDAWVRRMMKAAPDAEGYLADRLADGSY